MKFPQTTVVLCTTLTTVKAWTKEEKENIKECRSGARQEREEGLPGDPGTEGGKQLRLHCEDEFEWQFTKGYCPPYCLEATSFKKGARLDIKYCSKSPLQKFIQDGNVLRPAWNSDLCIKMGDLSKSNTGNRENAPSYLGPCNEELEFTDSSIVYSKWDTYPDVSIKNPHPEFVGKLNVSPAKTGRNGALRNRRLPQIDVNYKPSKYDGDFDGEPHFEIQYDGMCFTNPHHPKECEPVNWEPCERARNSITSFWRWETPTEERVGNFEKKPKEVKEEDMPDKPKNKPEEKEEEEEDEEEQEED